MEPTKKELLDRLGRLEARQRRVCVLLSVVLLGTVAVFTAGFAPSRSDKIEDVLRTRSLIIHDNMGKESILIGPKESRPGRRAKDRTPFGLFMKDPQGSERFSLNVTKSNQVELSLHAPRSGEGDKTAERLTMGVSRNSMAFVKLLDQAGGVRSVLYTDQTGRAFLELWTWTEDNVPVRRKIGALEEDDE